MNKISIVNPKLGELRFSLNSVDVPTEGLIVSARAGLLYEDGKAVQDKISKITLNVISYELAKIIKSSGGSINQLAPFTVELIGESDRLKEIPLDKLLHRIIDLKDGQGALQWKSFGGNGSWSGIKIIISKLKLIEGKM